MTSHLDDNIGEEAGIANSVPAASKQITRGA